MTASYRLEPPPPRDMESIAGFPRALASATAHSIPADTPALEPEPEQESTCTVMIVTPLATP